MNNHFTLDERRHIVIPGDHEQAVSYAVENWLEIAQNAIQDHGAFFVALSGGSTPRKIFQTLSSTCADKLDWSKVFLFWSDERSVLPTDPDSNYRMAVETAGLGKLPIPKDHIFRMVAEEDLEKNARAYEDQIRKTLGSQPFDLVMLGMGDDGHTASLFPYTKGVKVQGKLVTPNHVPQKDTWRMSLTFECINASRHIVLYVIGGSKKETLEKVLTSPLDPELYPSQLVGTKEHPATWLCDIEASQNLSAHLK